VNKEMATKKRRFGVSLPTEMADCLDQLASKLGVDRSSLIEDALKEYIHDHLHYLRPHKCMGVMIIIAHRMHQGIHGILERYKDIVSQYNHLHIGEKCIETMIIFGDSDKIAKLHEELGEAGCRIRYIPLAYELE